MNDTQVILEAIRQLDEKFTAKFALVDSKFEQIERRFDRIEEEAREFRKEVKEEFKDLKKDLKAETMRIDEVYGERKKLEMKWSSGFLVGNSALSALVAFFVSWLGK